ncbi:hypothetical protein ONZ45_g18654 [Pleurotus djamor]|nr:hypothetical protein ONZ45_g18654 [Pleurotus djamor]
MDGQINTDAFPPRPSPRTNDCFEACNLLVKTTHSPSPFFFLSTSALALISPTPRAFTFNHVLEDSTYSTPSSSPFQPELALGGGLEPFYSNVGNGLGGANGGNGPQTVLLPSAMSSTPPPRTLSSSVLSAPPSSSSNTSLSPSSSSLSSPNVLSSPITGSSTSSLTQTHKRRKPSHSVDPLDRNGGAERPPKKGDDDYIKRPENAFILLRRKRCEERDASSSNASTSPSNASPPSSTSVSSSNGSPSSSSSTIISTTSSFPATPGTSSIPGNGANGGGSDDTMPSRPLQNHLPATEVPRARGTRSSGGASEEKKRDDERMYPNCVYRPQRSNSKINSGTPTSNEGEGGKYIIEGGERKERAGTKGGRDEGKAAGGVEGKDGKVKEDEDKQKEERIRSLASSTPLLPPLPLFSQRRRRVLQLPNDPPESGSASLLPTPHSSQPNSNLLNSFASLLDGNGNAIANASFCSSGNGVVYSRNGYARMYRFDQGLDAFSVASTGMGIMDVDIGSVFANNSSSLNSPSSNSVANANDADADDANGQPSEAEMGRLTHILLFVVNRVYAG